MPRLNIAADLDRRIKQNEAEGGMGPRLRPGELISRGSEAEQDFNRRMDGIKEAERIEESALQITDDESGITFFRQDDGAYASVRTETLTTTVGAINVPTITREGEIVEGEDAIAYWQETDPTQIEEFMSVEGAKDAAHRKHLDHEKILDRAVGAWGKRAVARNKKRWDEKYTRELAAWNKEVDRKRALEPGRNPDYDPNKPGSKPLDMYNDAYLAQRFAISIDKVRELRAKGPITAGEKFGRLTMIEGAKFLPFDSGVFDFWQADEIRVHMTTIKTFMDIAKRHEDRIEEMMRTGKPIWPEYEKHYNFTRKPTFEQAMQKALERYDDTIKDLNESAASKHITAYLEERAEYAIRDQTWWAGVWTGAAALPGYMYEFWATRGLYGGAKHAVLTPLRAKVKSWVARQALRIVAAAAGTTLRTIVLSPKAFGKAYLQIAMPTVRRGTRGEFIIAAQDKDGKTQTYGEALRVALVDQWIENFSEVSGVAFGRAMSKTMPKMYRFLSKLKGGKWLKAGGFHGFAEELGEEQLGRFMRWGVGLTGMEIGEGSPFPTWYEFSQELAILGIPTGAGLVGKGVKKLRGPKSTDPADVKAAEDSVRDAADEFISEIPEGDEIQIEDEPAGEMELAPSPEASQEPEIDQTEDASPESPESEIVPEEPTELPDGALEKEKARLNKIPTTDLIDQAEGHGIFDPKMDYPKLVEEVAKKNLGIEDPGASAAEVSNDTSEAEHPASMSDEALMEELNQLNDEGHVKGSMVFDAGKTADVHHHELWKAVERARAAKAEAESTSSDQLEPSQPVESKPKAKQDRKPDHSPDATKEGGGEAYQWDTEPQPVPYEGRDNADLTDEEDAEQARAKNANKRKAATKKHLGVLDEQGYDTTITQDQLDVVTDGNAGDVTEVELDALGGDWKPGADTSITGKQVRVGIHTAGSVYYVMADMTDPAVSLGEAITRAVKEEADGRKKVTEDGDNLNKEVRKKVRAYHGSDDPITEYTTARDGTGSGLATGAVWFTDAPGVAKEWGETVNEADIDLKNPLVVDKHSRGWSSKTEPADLVRQAREGGHDGVIVKNVVDDGLQSTQYAVLDTSDITPITKESAGKVKGSGREVDGKSEGSETRQNAAKPEPVAKAKVKSAAKQAAKPPVKPIDKLRKEIPDAEDVGPKTDDEKEAAAFAADNAVEVVFVQTSDKKFQGRRSGNTIFVRSGMATDLVWETVAHEASHAKGMDTLLADHADAAELADARKRTLARATPAYRAELEKDPERLDREALALLIGEVMKDPAARARLKKGNPALYARILEAIRNAVAKLAGKSQFADKVLAEFRTEAVAKPDHIGDANKKVEGDIVVTQQPDGSAKVDAHHVGPEGLTALKPAKDGKPVYLGPLDTVELLASVSGDKGKTIYKATANLTNPFTTRVPADSTMITDQRIQELKDLGHDGVLWQPDEDGRIEEVVVFDPANVTIAPIGPKPPKVQKKSAKPTVKTIVPKEEGGDLVPSTLEQLNESHKYRPEDSAKTQVVATTATYRKIGPEIKKGEKVLDAGGGLGMGTKALRKSGVEVDLFEPYPDEGRIERLGGERPQYTDFQDVPDESYDVVIANFVVNVMPGYNAAEFLRDVHRVLKPGGRAYITTRSWSSIKSAVAKGTIVGPREVITAKGTFQKSYELDQLQALVLEAMPGAEIGPKPKTVTGTGLTVTRTAASGTGVKLSTTPRTDPEGPETESVQNPLDRRKRIKKTLGKGLASFVNEANRNSLQNFKDSVRRTWPDEKAEAKRKQFIRKIEELGYTGPTQFWQAVHGTSQIRNYQRKVYVPPVDRAALYEKAGIDKPETPAEAKAREAREAAEAEWYETDAYLTNKGASRTYRYDPDNKAWQVQTSGQNWVPYTDKDGVMTLNLIRESDAQSPAAKPAADPNNLQKMTKKQLIQIAADEDVDGFKLSMNKTDMINQITQDRLVRGNLTTKAQVIATEPELAEVLRKAGVPENILAKMIAAAPEIAKGESPFNVPDPVFYAIQQFYQIGETAEERNMRLKGWVRGPDGDFMPMPDAARHKVVSKNQNMAQALRDAGVKESDLARIIGLAYEIVDGKYADVPDKVKQALYDHFQTGTTQEDIDFDNRARADYDAGNNPPVMAYGDLRGLEDNTYYRMLIDLAEKEDKLKRKNKKLTKADQDRKRDAYTKLERKYTLFDQDIKERIREELGKRQAEARAKRRAEFEAKRDQGLTFEEAVAENEDMWADKPEWGEQVVRETDPKVGDEVMKPLKGTYRIAAIWRTAGPKGADQVLHVLVHSESTGEVQSFMGRESEKMLAAEKPKAIKKAAKKAAKKAKKAKKPKAKKKPGILDITPEALVVDLAANLGVDAELWMTKAGDLKLAHISVPKEQRSTGVGTTAMTAITNYADAHGLRLVLTPGTKDPSMGTTSHRRLVKFYKRFGFVENKGKDHRISESMFRVPVEAQKKAKPTADPFAPKPMRAPQTMTQAEYLTYRLGKRPEGVTSHGNDARSKTRRILEEGTRQDHEAAVRHAIMDGREVPANVLADYPGLQDAPAEKKPITDAQLAEVDISDANAQARTNRELRERAEQIQPDHMLPLEGDDGLRLNNTWVLKKPKDVIFKDGEKGENQNAQLVRNLERIMAILPEFAINPVLRFNGRHLVFDTSTGTFRFDPKVFGVNEKALSQGALVGIPLAKLGIDTAKYVKAADNLAKKGFPQRKPGAAGKRIRFSNALEVEGMRSSGNEAKARRDSRKGTRSPKTAKTFAKQIVAATDGRVNKDQAAAITALIEGHAAYLGITADEYIAKQIDGVIEGGPEAMGDLFQKQLDLMGMRLWVNWAAGPKPEVWDYNTGGPVFNNKGKLYFGPSEAAFIQSMHDFAEQDNFTYINQCLQFVRGLRSKGAGGGQAVRGNQKTFISVDITGNCEMREMGITCIYCYNEAPRSVKALGGKTLTTPPKVFDTAPYNGSILNFPKALIKFMNEQMGGLRMFSVGDYRVKDIPVIKQIVADAKAVGLNIKVITKQKDMIELLRNEKHVSFNYSTDFAESNFAEIFAGQPGLLNEFKLIKNMRDLVSRAPWVKDARKVQGRNSRIKIRYVAMNKADGIKAIMDPRFQVVTMYHGMTDPAKITAVWRFQNPDLYEKLGEERVQELATIFQDTKDVGPWLHKVTQAEIDEVLGDKTIPLDQFVEQGLTKLCCQTHKCGTCSACCGLAGNMARAQKSLAQLLDGDAAASVEFSEGGEALIRAFKAANVFSMAHEMGHIFRRTLLPADLRIAEEWAGVKNGQWDTWAEERFAREFERYLATGQAPTAELKSIFARFKEWAKKMYRAFLVRGGQIDTRLKGVFERMLGKDAKGETAAKQKPGSGPKTLHQNVVEVGVNINDSQQDFTGQILRGEKTIETRDSENNALAPLVGSRVGIVRTGKGKAMHVGFATVGEPVRYDTPEAFKADYDKHLVSGGQYGFKGFKIGYPLLDVEAIEPRPVPKAKGVIKTRPLYQNVPPNTDNVRWEHIEQLGTTTDRREAGYIKPDGALIDLSGKNEGGTPGMRSLDHREAGGTEGMLEFIAAGNVRFMPELPGVTLLTKPTAAQMAVIRSMAEDNLGAFGVDLQEGTGEWDAGNEMYRVPRNRKSEYFDAGTPVSKILRFINDFFDKPDTRKGIFKQSTVDAAKKRLRGRLGGATPQTVFVPDPRMLRDFGIIVIDKIAEGVRSVARLTAAIVKQYGYDPTTAKGKELVDLIRRAVAAVNVKDAKGIAAWVVKEQELEGEDAQFATEAIQKGFNASAPSKLGHIIESVLEDRGLEADSPEGILAAKYVRKAWKDPAVKNAVANVMALKRALDKKDPVAAAKRRIIAEGEWYQGETIRIEAQKLVDQVLKHESKGSRAGYREAAKIVAGKYKAKIAATKEITDERRAAAKAKSEQEKTDAKAYGERQGAVAGGRKVVTEHKDLASWASAMTEDLPLTEKDRQKLMYAIARARTMTERINAIAAIEAIVARGQRNKVILTMNETRAEYRKYHRQKDFSIRVEMGNLLKVFKKTAKAGTVAAGLNAVAEKLALAGRGIPKDSPIWKTILDLQAEPGVKLNRLSLELLTETVEAISGIMFREAHHNDMLAQARYANAQKRITAALKAVSRRWKTRNTGDFRIQSMWLHFKRLTGRMLMSRDYHVEMLFGRDGAGREILHDNLTDAEAAELLFHDQKYAFFRESLADDGIDIDKLNVAKWAKKLVTFKIGGELVEISQGELAGLIGNLRDSRTRELIMNEKHKGVEFASDPTVLYKITEADVLGITAVATPETLAIVKATMGWWSGPQMTMLNEASQHLEGRDIAVRQGYYPRHLDYDYFDKEPMSMIREWHNRMAEHTGQMKHRKEPHTTPILIDDIIHTFERHTKVAGTYITKQAATHDALRLLDDTDFQKYVMAYVPDGTDMLKRLRTYVREFHGLDHKALDSEGVLMRGFLRNFHVAALGIKPHIWLYQVVSYVSTLTDIKLRHWIHKPVLPTPELIRAISKVSPTLAARFNSSAYSLMSSAEIGATQRLGSEKNAWQKIQDASLYPIQYMDRVAIVNIWAAAQSEMKEQGFTGQALLEATARRTEQLVEQTQPTWGVGNSSILALKGRKNPLFKLVSLFSSQTSKYAQRFAKAHLRYSMGEISMTKMLKDMAIVTIIQAGMIYGIQRMMFWMYSGFKPDEDDEKTLLADMAEHSVGVTKKVLGQWLIVREISDHAIGQIQKAAFDDRSVDYAADGPLTQWVKTGSETFGGLIKTVADASTGKTDSSGDKKWPKDLKRASLKGLQFFSTFYGAPTQGPSLIIRKAMAENKAKTPELIRLPRRRGPRRTTRRY